MWYDSLGVQRDLSDSRYLFRDKWVDLDVAIAAMPDRKNELMARSEFNDLSEDSEEFYDIAMYYDPGRNTNNDLGFDGAQYDALSQTTSNRRARVKLIEAWYLRPCECQIFTVDRYAMPEETEHLSGLNGEEFDGENEEMEEAINTGLAQITETSRLLMFCAIFIKGSLLQNIRSPYKHQKFPFTPIWAYRNGSDNTPYSPIRPCRDPQEDLNKRFSKSLYLLSTNRIIMDKGAVDDVEELREEAADPAGIIEKKPGSELTIDRDISLAREHIMLANADMQYIQSISGVTGENLGEETNATSGKAIEARQSEGSATTTELFDNLRYAIQIQGEKQLSLIEQYYDYPKIIRITDDRDVVDFETINTPSSDGSEIENDIANNKADFVVGVQDWRQSLRVAMSEQVSQMMAGMSSDVAIQFLDLVFDLMDLPGKEEWVNRARQMNGQKDPQKEPTPEEQQQLQAQQQAQQEQEEFAKKQAMASLEEMLAKTSKVDAETDGVRASTLEKAVALVSELRNDPAIAPAADALVDSLD